MSSVYPSDDDLTDLFRIQFSKFLNVAALALFVFDYCLTFSLEVKHIWGTKWEVTRIVFSLTRYLSFVTTSLTCYAALADARCGNFILALDGLYTASVIFAEMVLIHRTFALWGRSRRVLFFLIFLAGTFIAAAEVTALNFKITRPGDATSPYQFYPSLCAYRSSRNAAWEYGFLMLYEIVLQAMSSWRRFRMYRGLRSRTLNTLYWDGIMYMSWIIIMSGINMTVMIAAPITYIAAPDTAQVAVHSVLACRIFFNLKECSRQTHTIGEDFSLTTLRVRMQSTTNDTTQIMEIEDIQ